MVTNELTFYLAAAALVVLTVENCVKLLNRDSSSITLAVYVTVFAWYFVDPFLNPEQYDYIPPFLISQSYGQVLIFLIAFRFFMRVAVRWVDSQDVVDVKPALRCIETANANCHAHSHRDRDANGDAWWPSHSVTAAPSNAGAPPVRGRADS